MLAVTASRPINDGKFTFSVLCIVHHNIGSSTYIHVYLFRGDNLFTQV